MEFFFAGYRLLADEEIKKYDYERYLLPFVKPQPYTHTFILHIGDENKLADVYGEAKQYPVVCDLDRYRIHQTKTGWAFVMDARDQEREKVLLCTRDYGEMTLYASSEHYYADIIKEVIPPFFPMSSLIRFACESGMALREGLPLHASLVEKDGWGILFLGPSGMGKSTQAKLWRDTLGADFLIGDRPGLRFINGMWVGFGMPWDGKDGICRQADVPVKACVSLSQAKENEIHRLSVNDAMVVMLNQAMMPMWDEAAMSGVSLLMARAASQIDFYHLSCLPDADAAFLTEKAVFGGNQ